MISILQEVKKELKKWSKKRLKVEEENIFFIKSNRNFVFFTLFAL